MKIIRIDENTIVVKTSMGRLDIKDNLENPKEGKAVAIAINVPWGVEIKGMGAKLIVLREKNKGKLKNE